MPVLAYIGMTLLTFVVLVAVLGLLPAWLSVKEVGNRIRGRLRIMQSNITLLAVVAAAAVFLGIHQLVASRAGQPFFLGLAAAGAVLVISSITTYVWLERQIRQRDTRGGTHLPARTNGLIVRLSCPWEACADHGCSPNRSGPTSCLTQPIPRLTR